jgi:outer membrane lipoprotein carrier protein
MQRYITPFQGGVKPWHRTDSFFLFFKGLILICYNLSNMRRSFWIFFFSLVCLGQTAEDVASQLEKTLDSTQTLEARFEHTFYSAVVSSPLKERGKLYFNKPDLMRWEYTDPENNIYLYKGDKFQWYFAEDNQLMRGEISDEGQETEILYLLTGKKNLLDFYSIGFSPFPTDNPKNAQIKLIPKHEDDGSFLLLEIDKDKWLIQKIVFMDWEGNKTEFQFSRIKVNASLPKNIFELKLPSDVEIIERD